MDTMTTTHQLGHTPGRARRCGSAVVACSSWRQHTVAPAFHGRGTTGVAGLPINAYNGNTTTLAAAKNAMFAKRHARHLETGST